MDKGVLAAIRRFPDRSLQIRRLALADGTFRSLCGDFGEAEEALAHWSQTSSPQAALRQSEYRGLMEELAFEIAAAVEVARGQEAE